MTPDFTNALPGIEEDWLRHDRTCTSLEYFWLPRLGGVSCPSDLDTCGSCGTTFFNEGIYDGRCDCCCRNG